MITNQNAQNAQAWGEFAARMHWQLFLTPTFSSDVSTEYARRSAENFVRSLSKDAYAIVGIERGVAGNRTHCHALVGGLDAGRRELADRRAGLLASVLDRWSHGNITGSLYSPSGLAAWYVTKNPADAHIVGTLREHRRHRRADRFSLTPTSKDRV